MRRWLPGVLALLVVVAAVGCDPTPRATLLLIGDSNWPSEELMMTTHWAADQPYVTAIESWPGLGLVDDDAYGDRFAADRTRLAATAIDADYVVTDLGINDAIYDVTTFGTELDAFLDGVPVGTRVIWIAPEAVGSWAPGTAAVTDALVAEQATRPDLWVIPIGEIFDLVDGCPVLVAGELVIEPIEVCRKSDGIHLSESGRIVLAALVRLYVDAAEAGHFGEDPIALAGELLDTVLPGAGGTTTTAGAPSTTGGTSTTAP